MSEIAPDVQFQIDAAVTAATTGLANKNSELLGKLKESTTALKRFDGIDVEKVAAMIASQSQADTDKLTKNSEWDKLRVKMSDAHGIEMTKKDAALSVKDKALSKYLIDAAAVTALAANKGSASLLLPHIRAAVKVVEESGNYIVHVLDAAGTPRVNGKGDFLTIDDLVKEMRQSDEYSRAFDADNTAGGGAAASKMNGMQQTNMTSVQKIAAGLSKMK